jgi:hypothetical protein
LSDRSFLHHKYSPSFWCSFFFLQTSQSDIVSICHVKNECCILNFSSESAFPAC